MMWITIPGNALPTILVAILSLLAVVACVIASVFCINAAWKLKDNKEEDDGIK